MDRIRNAPIGLKVALAPLVAIVLMLALGRQSWLGGRAQLQDLQALGTVSLQPVSSAQDLLLRITQLPLAINQSQTFPGMGHACRGRSRHRRGHRARLAEGRRRDARRGRAIHRHLAGQRRGGRDGARHGHCSGCFSGMAKRCGRRECCL
jgi:hypothetical protein